MRPTRAGRAHARRFGAIAGSLALLMLLLACGGGKPPGPRESLGASAPPLAIPSVAAPSVAPPSFAALPPTLEPVESLAPLPTSHAEPALDSLIDVQIRGVTLVTSSVAGEEAASAGGYLPALLDGLGKPAADLATAFAEDPDGNLELNLFALKVRDIGEQDLLNAFLDATSTHDAEKVEVAGRQVRVVTVDWTSYFYAKDGAVIVVAAADPALAAEAVQAIG